MEHARLVEVLERMRPEQVTLRLDEIGGQACAAIVVKIGATMS
jgi:hypothetical protein